MFFAACAVAVLCLVSVSHSAPAVCEELVRPLDHLDPLHLEGRWALIAASMEHNATADIPKGRDSIAIDFHGSTYTQVDNIGGQCQYYSQNITYEGHIFTIITEHFKIIGTFFNTSCHDCMVLSMDSESATYKAVDFYLMSRGREVDRTQMEEFRAQVRCLNMPPPFEKDPRKELCPEQVAKPEGNADGQ